MKENLTKLDKLIIKIIFKYKLYYIILKILYNRYINYEKKIKK